MNLSSKIQENYIGNSLYIALLYYTDPDDFVIIRENGCDIGTVIIDRSNLFLNSMSETVLRKIVKSVAFKRSYKKWFGSTYIIDI